MIFSEIGVDLVFWTGFDREGRKDAFVLHSPENRSPLVSSAFLPRRFSTMISGKSPATTLSP
jgi:hypothetical protein